jgi:hypothetical protein
MVCLSDVFFFLSTLTFSRRARRRAQTDPRINLNGPVATRQDGDGPSSD